MNENDIRVAFSFVELLVDKRLLQVAGGGLLVASSAIHLDLYLTGYRYIPTIGWMFLLQIIAGFALGLAIVVTGQRLLAVGGVLFALSILGGYVLSMWVGLFGFKEVRTTAGIVAAVLEITAVVVLALLATTSFAPARRAAVVPVAAVAMLLVALVESGAVGAVAAAPSQPAGGRSTGTGQEVRIDIKNFVFSPAKIVATPGETIAVTNEDGVVHTFTAVAGTSPAFNSGDVNPNQTITLKAPKTPGTYSVHCTIHPFMKAVLVVKA
jgi:plastocyanin